MDLNLESLSNIFNKIESEYNFVYEMIDKKVKINKENQLNKVVNQNDKKEILKLKARISELEKEISNYEQNKNKENKKEVGINYEKLEIVKLNKEIEKLKLETEKLKKENLNFVNQICIYKNELIDLQGSIRVLVRINQSDRTSNISYTNTSINIESQNKKLKFVYDKVFDTEITQLEVFSEVQSIVESVFEGYKICMFAYGQTGSGKTYTMVGNENCLGLIYRFFNLLFSKKKILELNGFQVQCNCTFIEIYNDNIITLSTNYEITNYESTVEHFEQTCKKRVTESTDCNKQSSRSHLICNINICIKSKNETRNGILCFIDLAGSERISQSHVSGTRMKETQSINKSLSSLGDVFMAILNKSKHIPFRNSKLTYFLSDFLTGNSRVVMILNISGNSNHLNETINTLRFGEKISQCKLGKIEKNVTKQL